MRLIYNKLNHITRGGIVDINLMKSGLKRGYSPAINSVSKLVRSSARLRI